ncbi:MAG: precorrin-6y C5,15-methyltransferase (decarboxylating) subunit CbiE [Rhodobacteraceae bacterium]|nr:precorrin-6y C5,15-methyltransferase (decarboxylating) subunit CbiE [Paracoccaceae bacterium]
MRDSMPASIDVIGVGESGRASLSTPALEALSRAEVIIGGKRHHKLAGHCAAQRVLWPSPFSKMIGELAEHGGRRVAVIVTGDPLWYSAGALIARQWPRELVRFHPQISAFQLACCRMKWSLADVETLTVHGRPAEEILPWLSPGSRLVVLTANADSPAEISRLLVEHGYSGSRLTVLGALGGKHETRMAGIAGRWSEVQANSRVPDFHTLCIECEADADRDVLPRGPGLPDDAFATDGNYTKGEVRAITVCALRPGRGKLLWDIGCGHGTVAIEWMRAGRDARAVGIERNAKRAEMARRNAKRLGAPRLDIRIAEASEVVATLPPPDSIFIGGGLTRRLAEQCLSRLGGHGRIVANAVTLESQQTLSSLHMVHGGELVNIAISHCMPIGSHRGWKPQRPVVQWRLSQCLAN